LEGADVYVESYKAGQLDKWGFTDEELWKINPRLIIAHHSGFGQTGDPNYVSKPSFDPIAQAFGGHMDGNRGPDTAPHTIGPFAGDYASGLILTVGILAALYNVSKTGVGESVDVAQYECMMRINSPSVDFLTAGTPIRPTGYPNRMAGQSTYKCKDGAYIQTCFAGYANIKKVIPFLNLEYGGEDFPEGIGLVATDTEGGKKLEAALTAYAATKTASEAESEFLAMGLPATKVNSVADLDNLPHVKARKTIAEYENLKGVKIRAVGVVPTFKKSPGRVWRPCPYQGMDNEEILKDLGYSKEEIDGFYGKQILGRDAEMKYLYPYKKPGE
jgi:L-carnitine CoA-transferase